MFQTMSRETLFSSPGNPPLLPSPPLNHNPNPPLPSPFIPSPPLPRKKPTFLSPSSPSPPWITSIFHSPQMGCGTSRMESGDEIPSGLLPFTRRIHDLKRTKTDLSRRERRERKDSIVSTTELLRPEERDIDYYDAAVMEGSGEKDENAKGNEASDPSETVKEKVENAEEEGRRIGFGREAAAEAEEDLPGSPSFRFYFIDAAQTMDNGGSVQPPKSDALKCIEEKELVEEKEVEEKEGQNESLVAAEGSDLKAIKKEKGRKFMTLPKANFLNVRGCYNINSCSIDAQEGTRILNEKAASDAK